MSQQIQELRNSRAGGCSGPKPSCSATLGHLVVQQQHWLQSTGDNEHDEEPCSGDSFDEDELCDSDDDAASWADECCSHASASSAAVLHAALAKARRVAAQGGCGNAYSAGGSLQRGRAEVQSAQLLDCLLTGAPLPGSRHCCSHRGSGGVRGAAPAVPSSQRAQLSASQLQRLLPLGVPGAASAAAVLQKRCKSKGNANHWVG